MHRIAGRLLDENFPGSVHDDILDAVGMPWTLQAEPRRRRDPAFRSTILRIYEHRCAVCGYDGRLGSMDLGLEAAHVMWHAAGGPDLASNGIALCAFHHKAFDRGALGLSEDLRLLVSQDVHGGPAVQDWLVRYAAQPLRRPQTGQPPPSPDFTAWHRREVFRQPPRLGA